jgi:hypothetical protein
VRFVPETLDPTGAVADTSGALRWTVQGIRLLSPAAGRARGAEERLSEPLTSVALPGRLGGGFLFVVGDTVYRSDDWLASPRPIFRSIRGIADVFSGLDRVYVRTRIGSHVAIDAKTGNVLDVGPLPPDPFVGPFVALDGWRALAITDVGGLVGTANAGRSWARVELPFRAGSLRPLRRDAALGTWTVATPDAAADAFEVTDDAGREPRKDHTPTPGATTALRCAVVTGDLTPMTRVRCEDIAAAPEMPPRSDEGAVGPGLAAALRDGWPLDDGTIVVAGAGTLSWVSLTDGSLADTVDRAFERAFASCHAVSLSTDAAANVGFVCGEAGGRTALYVYDAPERRLAVARIFGSPRTVETSRGGGWLVRGGCSDDDAGAKGLYCAGSPSRSGYDWREVHDTDSSSAVATLLSNGQLVRVSSPDNLEDARLSRIAADGSTLTVPLRWTEASDAMRKFVPRASWLGGFEERRPNVLGGWMTADGTVAGVEIDLAGLVTTGPLIRDMGSPFVAGRYGLGWHARSGFETTDGGMTWSPVALPASLSPSRERACGPAGCLAEGWLKIGWGSPPPTPPIALIPGPAPRDRAPTPVSLRCEAGEPWPSRVPEPPSPPNATFIFGLAEALNAPILLPSSDGWFSPPHTSHSETLLSVNVYLGLQTTVVAPRGEPLGRIFAWGPSAGEWGGSGHWAIRWRSPFASLRAPISSAVVPAPFQDIDAARADLGMGRGPAMSFTMEVSDDPSHALLVTRPANRPLEVTMLDEGASTTPVRRLDGQPWAGLDAAVRVEGTWFLATPVDTNKSDVRVYRVGGGTARPLAIIRRLLAGVDARSVKLAKSSADGLLGLVVEGEPGPDRRSAMRWVIPIDVASGEIRPAEPLGAADLSDRPSVVPCSDTTGPGWVFDTRWPEATVRVRFVGSDDVSVLRQSYMRLRISSERACIERLTGDDASDTLASSRRGAPREMDWDPALPTLPVVAVSDRPRALRCQGSTK